MPPTARLGRDAAREKTSASERLGQSPSKETGHSGPCSRTK